MVIKNNIRLDILTNLPWAFGLKGEKNLIELKNIQKIK